MLQTSVQQENNVYIKDHNLKKGKKGGVGGKDDKIELSAHNPPILK